MRHWALAGLLVLTAVPAAAQTADAKDVAEIKATMVAMWDAIEKGDVDRYATYVHPDFTSFGENDVYITEGKDAEIRSYRDYLRRATGVHTDMHQPVVTVRGDTAWVTYYWTDAGTIEGTRFTSRGKSTRIFVRENGRWLCIHGHYTAVP
ncbi:MAG: nuclear transport factor 2 family protein [Acidobacteriota bacterium]|nr:nuclear transport factor 2 family protein [Acidobacteriota bacterium]